MIVNHQPGYKAPSVTDTTQKAKVTTTEPVTVANEMVAPGMTTVSGLQQFGKEYFSGANVQIYMGDTYIDEITSLEYTIQENVTPIYGFASHTWDTVARGTRLVQGSFAINFREAGYLNVVLDRLAQKMDAAGEGKRGFDDAGEVLMLQQSEWNIQGMTIEQLLAQEEEDFESLTLAYEEAIWGAGEKKKDFGVRQYDSFFYPRNQFAKNSVSQSALRKDGFNILVDFGRNMDLGRIKCLDAYKEDMNTVKTQQAIMNIQLTSMGKQVTVNGQAIQEVYTFIARDIDGLYAER